VTDRGSDVLPAEMTCAQVHSEVGRGRSTVVVPFRAIDQDGPHLPLDTNRGGSGPLGNGFAALAANGILRDPGGASSDAGPAYVTAFLDTVERQLDEAPPALTAGPDPSCRSPATALAS
jgi:creatinine amidohydrolase/Fe(II)-dependent formamide hydrolase-like protein